jgi:hypothetical protein
MDTGMAKILALIQILKKGLRGITLNAYFNFEEKRSLE